MFDRFSGSVRSAVFRARDIACAEDQRFVEPTHILLAMIELYPELFEKLSNYSVDLSSVQRELMQRKTSMCASQKPTKLRLNEESKRVMKAAAQQARFCWEQWEGPRRQRGEMLPEDQIYWEARLKQPIKITQFPKWFVRWRLHRRWEVDERHLLLGLLEEEENPGVAVVLQQGVTVEAARQRLCAITR